MSTAQFAAMTRGQAEAFMPNAQRQAARRRLAELVAGRPVLDIGCGKGEEVGELYTVNQYHGLDCSAQLIEIARQRWPRYLFAVGSAQELAGDSLVFPVAIMKAVLEHLPPDEAVQVYEAARRVAAVLYVAWHTEPGVERLSTYEGELGTMLQHRHDRSRFAGVTEREVCGPHVIWTVEGA